MGYHSLADGEEVEYVVKSFEGRPKAIEVTSPNGNPIRCSFKFGQSGGSGGSMEGKGKAVTVEVVADVISVVR
ncbi:hypothetical protein PVK06_038223 [Gossypium arboreum]|uniref:Uncharacterized protein n=1 Tax=Gossypium arboreum TaxID=29729 RepID=A0ABR0MZI4_GOSAR|nr:hypothetical protein PVK06_038223 [Gossypium arboreum]